MIHSFRLHNLKEDWFNSNPPTKLTECRRLRVNTVGWGLLTDYTLESVKISSFKTDKFVSTAVIRVADRSGHISCIVKGIDVGLLFGVSREEWKSIEKLSRNHGQLFYRYFQHGVKEDVPFEQKMFYYFCQSAQCKDILVVQFVRAISERKIDENKALLKLIKIEKCTSKLLEYYNLYYNES